MGRWGFRLFEGDRDLDTCDDVETMVVNFLKSDMGDQILTTPEMREAGQNIIGSAEGPETEASGGSYLLDNIRRGDPVIRMILDNAVCMTLLDLAKGDEFSEIIIGALMMQAGAQLRDEDKTRLREILACFPDGHDELPENGFNNAGQAQFSAALDHYRAGVPRDFQTPSCFNCGKIEADIGNKLIECERCLVYTWCNEECKAAIAAKHMEYGPCTTNGDI